MPAKGIGISPYFKKAAAAAVTPSPLIASWYTALSVKPSAALLTALNTLVDGMNTDGDWTELDFFALAGGMETQEQALRPLKTTGSATMTNFDNGGGGLTWTVNGFQGNNTDVILTGFNPSSNGVKYVLNSAYLGFFGNTTLNTSVASFVVGIDYSPDDVVFYETTLKRTMTATTLTTASSYCLNSSTLNTSASKTKTSGNANFPYYIVNKRTGAANNIMWNTGVQTANNTGATTGIPNEQLVMMGFVTNYPSTGVVYTGCPADYGRATLCGSGNVSQTNTGSRLNTFFSARSLNPYV